jgi:alkyl hydroperoxide reductase subunit AhpC
MKGIESCISTKDNIFYVDLIKWESISDIRLELNDVFDFKIDNKKYSVKVISIIDDDAKLKQI